MVVLLLSCSVKTILVLDEFASDLALIVLAFR